MATTRGSNLSPAAKSRLDIRSEVNVAIPHWLGRNDEINPIFLVDFFSIQFLLKTLNLYDLTDAHSIDPETKVKENISDNIYQLPDNMIYILDYRINTFFFVGCWIYFVSCEKSSGHCGYRLKCGDCVYWPAIRIVNVELNRK